MAQLTPLGLIKIMAQVTAIMVISILGSAVAGLILDRMLATSPLLVLVKFQQRYQNSHRIFRNLLCWKNVRQFCGSQNWLLFSRPILGAYSTGKSPSIPPSDDYVPHLTGSSDAQIQLISGHESKKSLEIYQHLSLDAVEQAYQEAVQGVSI